MDLTTIPALSHNEIADLQHTVILEIETRIAALPAGVTKIQAKAAARAVHAGLNALRGIVVGGGVVSPDSGGSDKGSS